MEKDLGWKPAILLEQGTAQTIDWYTNNSAWMEGVRGGDTVPTTQNIYENRDRSLQASSRPTDLNPRKTRPASARTNWSLKRIIVKTGLANPTADPPVLISLLRLDTSLPGVWEFHPKIFRDPRGFFMETTTRANSPN